LFFNFNVGKAMLFCETSIFKMKITSSPDLPQKTVLLKFMDSKMMQKGFQSIKESI
jgi:hypothetical protein